MNTDKATPRPWGIDRDGVTLTMSGQIVATAIAPDGATIAFVSAKSRTSTTW